MSFYPLAGKWFLCKAQKSDIRLYASGKLDKQGKSKSVTPLC